MPNISAQRGISLVELLIVTTTIGFLAILIAAIPNAITSVTKSQHRSLARNIASKQINYLRQQGFANLANGSSSFTDLDLEKLPQSSALQEISNCPVEVCTNNESVKSVQVTVAWVDSGATQSATLSTLVGLGGIGQ